MYCRDRLSLAGSWRCARATLARVQAEAQKSGQWVDDSSRRHPADSGLDTTRGEEQVRQEREEDSCPGLALAGRSDSVDCETGPGMTRAHAVVDWGT